LTRAAAHKQQGAQVEPRQTELTVRLAAQGAMLNELRALVPLVDPQSARDDVRRLVLDENVLQRDNIASREKVFQKFSTRYVPQEAPVATASFFRAVQAENDPAQIALCAYVMMAWRDALVYLLGEEWLAQKLRIAGFVAQTDSILDELEWLADNRAPEIGKWGHISRARVAQHYLGLLRDCGFATGSLRKELRSPYVAPTVILFGAQLIMGGGEPAANVPEHSLFRVLGLTPADVIDALTELNAEGRITFAVQGNVAHIALEEAHA
jgi:Putative inner membrane protein (DUF1819)